MFAYTKISNETPNIIRNSHLYQSDGVSDLRMNLFEHNVKSFTGAIPKRKQRSFGASSNFRPRKNSKFKNLGAQTQNLQIYFLHRGWVLRSSLEFRVFSLSVFLILPQDNFNSSSLT